MILQAAAAAAAMDGSGVEFPTMGVRISISLSGLWGVVLPRRA